MKEMSLKDVQDVSLDILKHLHIFCSEHNIKYSLGYGSLIGAIRHKGFIPWDDDIDIVMMREDFNRFCAIYQDSPQYKLFSFNRKNTYAVVARLCDMKKTLVKTGTPLFTEPTGVWIDIFPLDSVDDLRNVFDNKKSNIIDIHKEIFQCRYQMRSFDGIKSIIHFRKFLSWIRYVRKARNSIFDLLKKQNDLCISFVNYESKMMSMLAFPAYIEKDFSPKRVFNDVIEVPFEDASFNIMRGYDEWLTIIYGDYMTPPKDENSKRGHTAHKYFWK